MTKRIVFASILAFLLSSCASTSYFANLRPANDEQMQQEENGDFVVEREDISIAYSFRGVNAPMQITIFNKSDEDIYIDWKQSEMRTQSHIYSYMPNVFNISQFRSTGHSPEIFDEFGKLDKALTKLSTQSEELTMVPPRHMMSYVPLELDGYLMRRNVEILDFQESVMTSTEGKEYKIGISTYTPTTSPLLFRSIIQYFTPTKRPMTVHSDFHVGAFIKSKSFDAYNIPDDMLNRGDFFYIYYGPREYREYSITVGASGMIGF